MPTRSTSGRALPFAPRWFVDARKGRYKGRVSDAPRETDAARIAALAVALGRALPAHAVAPLVRYIALVRAWSGKVNLVSARSRTDVELVEVSFADALVLADASLVPQGSRMIDVGAGAGAPSLPLLVLRPDLHATCVEPRHKRAAFLLNAGQALDLRARLTVLERRIDPAAPAAEGGPFDVALSRATLAPPLWLAMGVRLASRVLVMTAREQPPDAPEGFRVVAQTSYALPSSGAARRITAYATTRSADATAGAPG